MCLFFKSIHFLSGLTFGLFLFAACGGSSLIADTIGKAIDVSFDNQNSNLSSENVQDAIHELSEKITLLESSISTQTKLTSTELEGSWTGTTFANRGINFFNITLTLNSNGTYSCSGDDDNGTVNNEFSGPRTNSPVCLNAGTWEVKNMSLVLNFTESMTARNVVYPVLFRDNSNLELLTGDDDGFMVTVLTK